MKRRAVLPWLATLIVMPCAPAPGSDPFAHPVTDEAQLRALLSRPAEKLRKAQVLEGQFRHSRHLREIPKPLVALGEFTFVRDLGVYWHTRQPFDSVVVLTGAGLAQSDDGGPVQRISADEQPAVRLITNIFMALFTLDTQSLSRDFDLFGGVVEGNRWIIGLKPRAKAIAGVFSQATVAGAGEVEQVVLTDAQGDRTLIDLTGIRYSSDLPGADVRALFALPRP
ncbi:MAG TPA: outer membrane lipoprotein carrier protein LolA [Steroidobacteraceae bacterium]|nr:outer membrane lipoprotein carrier protein LolA [Steroidobacteraceae bacterium]